MQSELNGVLRRFLHWAEVDRAVISAVLARIWQSASALVTVWVIAFYFIPELQGYYYTFVNLLALQVLAELGLGTVIIQFASHEWSRLSLDERGRIFGDKDALSRLVSLGRFAFRWTRVAGAIVVVGLGLAGYAFFSDPSYPSINWMGPWFLLCLLMGMKLFLLPVWSLLEGCNQVSSVYFYRLINGVVTGVSLWLAIMMGAQLWAAAVAVAVELVWGGVFVRWRYWRFLGVFLTRPTGPRISWRSEVCQMQWRIALSFVSGYPTFYLFTPVLFKFEGAVAAGQMGMTWAVVSALSVIASAWVFPKASQFGLLIARREYAELDRLIFRLTVISTGIACIGALIIWAMLYLLYSSGLLLAMRILPPLPTGLFLLATVLMQISFCQSAYLRAHKKEPLVLLSVAQGVLTGVSTWVLGRHFGATGMAAGYLSVVALIVVPFGTVIWHRCRAAWHADAGNMITSERRGDRPGVSDSESFRLLTY